MKNTIMAISRLCMDMESSLAVAPVEEIFAQDFPEKQLLVGYAKQIGLLAATLPEEKGLDALIGKITYVRKVGAILQQADTNIVRTFCKYDIQEFICTCQKILENAS